MTPAKRAQSPAGPAAAGRLAWLVDGDDPNLVSEGVRAVVEELLGGIDATLAVEDFRGDEVDVAAVADACQTPPFLADRRIVVLRDVGRFSAEEVAPLIAYLEAPLETTALVLAAGAGRLPSRLVAAVRKVGHVTGTHVESRDARAWLKDRLRSAPVRLDAQAEAVLGAHLGEDLSRLTSILAVLEAAYGEGARLGADQLAPYLGEAGSVAPWDLTDAIDAGRTEVALELLHRLLEAGDRHPLVVLAILHRHVASILRVDGGDVVTEAQAAAALGIPSGRSTFPAKKALTAARRLGPARVAELTGLVADAEIALKGGQALPETIVLEVLVARMCRLMRSAQAHTGARA
ncbi:MAG TPA: DNA polymerase III subunit delta [Acidimicrobiales bacterium]|nr:DNA polymerase III subunit delta [Acidimicrobiales bacterium]